MTTDLERAYEECRIITRREAKNFYYAFLTLPAERRRAIYVAYTFCRHCDDSVDAEGSSDAKLVMVNDLREKLDQTEKSPLQRGIQGDFSAATTKSIVPEMCSLPKCFLSHPR